MSRTTIRSVVVEPLNIPLLEPFTIATGGVTEARNVLITVTLADGSIGYGESAPFSPSTGIASPSEWPALPSLHLTSAPSVTTQPIPFELSRYLSVTPRLGTCSSQIWIQAFGRASWRPPASGWTRCSAVFWQA